MQHAIPEHLSLSKTQCAAYSNILRALAAQNTFIGIASDTLHLANAIRFPLREVECTGTHVPHAETVRSIVERAPEHLVWNIPVDTEDLAAFFASNDWQLFLNALKETSHKKQRLIFSFDSSIEYSSRVIDSVECFRDEVPEIPCLIESAHGSWKKASSQKVLKSLRLCHTFLDAPHLPGLVTDVSFHVPAIGYLRIVGRNGYNWFKAELEQRYAYQYSKEELTEIALRVKRLQTIHEQVFVAFCNRPALGAMKNALQLAHYLI
jgi:uncharacterized protein YecE (DUF72 family)